MAVAGDQLCGSGLASQSEALTGYALHLRIAAAIDPDRTGELPDPDSLQRAHEPMPVPLQLEGPAGQFGPERDRLRVDAVRATHHRGFAVLLRAGHDRRERALEPVEDELAGILGLEGESRVEDIRRCQAVVQPATDGPELFLDGVDEGSEVVLRPRLDRGDTLRRRDVGTFPDLSQCFARDDPCLGPALERSKLHLEPPRELPLIRPDRLHGRTGVTLDHPSDCSGGAGGLLRSRRGWPNPTPWTVRMVRRRWPGIRFS